VHAVVDPVACDNQPDVRDVQGRRVISVGMPEADGDERMSLKLEERAVQRISDGVVVRDLAGESR
jgi:hypothetical protein